MPLFEYRCKQCGEVSEILVKTNSREKPVCQKCGSAEVEKLLSSPAVHVKGGSTTAPACGREVRCCGRGQPCDAPSCGKD
ncbi:MAG: zinc ribbon domain-containing protein [Planctomycetes bacterium]|nr:zinc ribbon domain-containing protein [Planctomycetota bacterium]